MNRLLFDTCFLIDLEKELRRGVGRARAFLENHRDARPHICWTVAGEFAEGFGGIHHPACSAMLACFDILPMDEKTADAYARTARMLRTQNLLIGANDLWIAAAALSRDLPLVTNNTAHFARVPGLAVIGY